MRFNVKNDWYEVRKISDKKKYLFVEKEMLKDMLTTTNTNTANSKQKIHEKLSPKKPSKFIIYLDMNNLYGWAMNEYLPYEGFSG